MGRWYKFNKARAAFRTPFGKGAGRGRADRGLKMKIAIMADGPELSAAVSPVFADGPWLLIVEDEDGSILEAVPRGDLDDVRLARKIVDSGCEGLLCGPIEKEAFLIIADEGGVTRYLAAGLSGNEALAAFGRRSLEYIRDYIGGEGQAHHHHGGGECSGRH